MFGRILASAAIIGVMAIGVPAAMAQSTTPSDQQSPKSSTMSNKSTTGKSASQTKSRRSSTASNSTQMTSGKSSGTTSRASAQGHKLDHISDKLNACQAQPEAQRQACMSQATAR